MLGFDWINWKKVCIFGAGVLFGTAGVSILSSKDAKKCYTKVTAAALRAKDKVMHTATEIQENCEDILSDAKAINEERTKEEEARFAGEHEAEKED